MRHRNLGTTGMRVSELGYSAWGIGGAGWVGADDAESRRALEAAIERGVNFIDTARGYGDSERIVGEVVRAGLPTQPLVPPCGDWMAVCWAWSQTSGQPSAPLPEESDVPSAFAGYLAEEAAPGEVGVARLDHAVRVALGIGQDDVALLKAL